jgi:membrane protease YdiL (CAAX protease family)
MSSVDDPSDFSHGESDPALDSNAPSSSPASPEPAPLEAAILSYESTPSQNYETGTGQMPPGVPQGPGPAGQFQPHSPIDPDLRVPWGWLDLLLLVVVWFGATLGATILLAILFAARGMPFGEIQHSPRDLGLFVVVDQLIVSVFVLIYLWLQARVRFNSPFWRTLGWRRLETGERPRGATYLKFIGLGVFLALAVQAVSAAFPAKSKLPIENLLQNRQAALALMIMSVVLAPVVEETVFRGYIYPVVARSFGVAAGIIGTGTVFGLLHAEQLWGGWAQIALLVIVGIVFTWVRAVKRTVFASYLLHVSYNSVLFVGYLISISGLRSLIHR